MIGSLSSSKLNTFSPDTFVNRTGDLTTLEDWSFDAVNTEDAEEKHRLVWAMLNEFGLVKEFNIDLNVLCEFITQIKDGYQRNNNAYHNYSHGITGKFLLVNMLNLKL